MQLRGHHWMSRGLASCLALGLTHGSLAEALAADPSTGVASPENWAQWRGPSMTGVAPQATPPVSWSERENVKWKVKLPGQGTSTPIIWRDAIFVTAAISKTSDASAPAATEPAPGQGADPGRVGGGGPPRSETPSGPYQFVLLCLDRKTGAVQWQKVAAEVVPHEGHHRDHGFASHSPVTDGRHVFAYFGSRGLYAFDLQGNLQWKKDLGQMRTRNAFGEGSSPGLFGDTLVVNWDHEGDDFVVAFDKNTGKELWRQQRDEPTTWSTPLFVQVAGKTQVLCSGSNKIRSYDLSSGKVVWEGSGMTVNVIPTPLAEDGMAYFTSGFRGAALLAIRLGAQGNVMGTDAVVWQHAKNTPYVPSPLLHRGRLYFFSGNNGLMSCLEAKTGKVLIDAERLEALQGVYASPVAAGDRVYLVGRNGATVVIKAADQLHIEATNRLDDAFDASPALAGKDLLLRGRANLYCLSEM